MAVLWILAAIAIGVSVIEGFRHGVVRRVVELVGLVAILLFASRLSAALEPWISDNFDLSGRAVFFTSWAVVIVGGLIGVRLLAIVLQRAVRISLVGWLDRTGGAVLGAAFGLILVSCLFIVALALPLGDDVKDEIRHGPVASQLLHVAPSVYDVLSEMWDGQDFFELIDEHVEPAARKAVEKLEAVVDEVRSQRKSP